jgi:hypothetical protein
MARPEEKGDLMKRRAGNLPQGLRPHLKKLLSTGGLPHLNMLTCQKPVGSLITRKKVAIFLLADHKDFSFSS